MTLNGPKKAPRKNKPILKNDWLNLSTQKSSAFLLKNDSDVTIQIVQNNVKIINYQGINLK